MKPFIHSITATIIGGCFLMIIACSTARDIHQPGQPASLYDRLGGKSAITAVVDTFVANVAADNRINHRFATTNIPQLKTHLVDQICEATGGPCTYTGRDMKTTHAGMRITNADFNALVEDLVAAFHTLHVPQAEQHELLAVLGPMKADIVELP